MMFFSSKETLGGLEVFRLSSTLDGMLMALVNFPDSNVGDFISFGAECGGFAEDCGGFAEDCAEEDCSEEDCADEEDCTEEDCAIALATPAAAANAAALAGATLTDRLGATGGSDVGFGPLEIFLGWDVLPK